MKITSVLPLALTQKYSALPPRDRRALLVLCVFLAAVILWRGIWLPLENATLHYSNAYKDAAADYAWMKAQAPKFPTPQPNVAMPALGTGNSITIITTTAELFQVRLSRTEPTQGDTIQVSIASAPFNRVISWLELLQREHRLNAVSAVFEKLPAETGHVSAQLTLAPI